MLQNTSAMKQERELTVLRSSIRWQAVRQRTSQKRCVLNKTNPKTSLQSPNVHNKEHTKVEEEERQKALSTAGTWMMRVEFWKKQAWRAKSRTLKRKQKRENKVKLDKPHQHILLAVGFVQIKASAFRSANMFNRDWKNEADLRCAGNKTQKQDLQNKHTKGTRKSSKEKHSDGPVQLGHYIRYCNEAKL